jgi:murein L,D-transpeptidase YcbB/YkuD
MRVVVGDRSHRTPLFASAMAAVVFNPPWNVPASIAAKELYPKERARPGYLSRNRFRLVDGHLQQAPGAGNALGRLKFDFDSPFGVYLHDTPSKSAFTRDNRFLSHGCIRLQAPDALAQQLLGAQGWSAETIEAAIQTGQTRRVDLSARTPLYVTYFTAFVDDRGRLNFRDDAYGWDRLLASALRAAGVPAGVRHGDRLFVEAAPGYAWPGAMESTCQYDAVN